MALLGLSSSLGHGGSAVNGGLQLSAIRRSRVLALGNPHLVSISPFSTATSPWAYHQPCSQELVPSLAWNRIELTKTLVGSALSRLPTQQIRPPGRRDIRNALPRLQPLLSSSYYTIVFRSKISSVDLGSSYLDKVHSFKQAQPLNTNHYHEVFRNHRRCCGCCRQRSLRERRLQCILFMFRNLY